MNLIKIIKNQSGQVAKLMLALIIVCFVAIAIAYIVIKSAEKPAKPIVNDDIEVVPQAVYEETINDIKLTFQGATNFGNTLKGENSKNPRYQKDLTTTEKFIMVTIGAQNKGKADTPNNVWELGNIIDSEGRNFVPAKYTANPWIPETSQCGDVLKPEFTPTPCTVIYEVAKSSEGLKIQVIVERKKEEGKYDSSNKDAILLDLIINDK